MQMHVATIQSEAWGPVRQPVNNRYEIYSVEGSFYVRFLDWPGVPRVEPIDRFLQEWHAGRCLRRLFQSHGLQPWHLLDGATLRTGGTGSEIIGGPLNGLRF